MIFIVVVGVFLHWLWRKFIGSRRGQLLDKPEGNAAAPVNYELQDYALPRLTGTLLAWAARLIDSVVGKWFIIPSILRRSNMFLLRSFRMQNAPTFHPLVFKGPATSCTTIRLSDGETNKGDESGRAEPIGFCFASIVDYSDAYRSGKTTPVAVAESVLHAIANSDEGSKPLRTFVQINEDEVKRMAAESAKRFQEGRPLSLFDGVPVGIKEQLAVQLYHLRCGTVFMGNEACTDDATVVKKLRAAGALIIGITNLHELGSGTLGSNPNCLHGTSRNPYNTDHYTGGSSSGSAAAVAAGLVPLAIGTDGGGSLRIPSTLCGVVTLKATYGRISNAGSPVLSGTVSSIGPICSCVSDIALAYDLLAGPDPHYPLGLCQPPVEKCAPLLNGSSLSGVKIGIYSVYFKHADKNVVDVCERVVQQLSEQEADIIPIEIPELEEARVAHMVTILSEMSTFLRKEREENGALMNPDVRIASAIGSELTTVDYLMAQQQRTRNINFLNDIFNTVDCILTPGCPITAPVISEKAIKFGDSDSSTSMKLMRYSFLGNLTGVPSVILPVGYDSQGLPIGLQIIGKWWDEQFIIQVAVAVERLVEKKKPRVHYSIL